MKKDIRQKFTKALLLVVFFVCPATLSWASSAPEQAPMPVDSLDDEIDFEEAGGAAWENGNNDKGISDPLEPVNRMFFVFNDRLYFWVLKPVAKGYRAVVPKPARIGIRNFFTNIIFPVRLVNNLLQGKFKKSGTEIERFLINTTFGVAGLRDPAKIGFGLAASDEDFGQTLGLYGVGGVIYICWPFLGPSNVRDSIGMTGDYFFNPVPYLGSNHLEAAFVVSGGEKINKVSLNIGDYESLIEASFDPYTAVRDAYQQHRKSSIAE